MTTINMITMPRNGAPRFRFSPLRGSTMRFPSRYLRPECQRLLPKLVPLFDQSGALRYGAAARIAGLGGERVVLHMLGRREFRAGEDINRPKPKQYEPKQASCRKSKNER